MNLDLRSAHELASAIQLDLALESYRERLTPLAQATLSGSSRRTIDKARERVLPDVWDDRLGRAVVDGVARLRALVEAAEADLARGPRASRVATAVVDRVLFELLEDQDRNIAALEALEAELRDVPPDERPGRARRAVRGAGTWTRIPRNDIRAAIVRVSRTAAKRGLDRPDAFDESARQLARLLASNERREAARGWVAEMAAVHAEPFPLLAEELRRLAAAPASADPGEDPLWVETCLGIALVESLGES